MKITVEFNTEGGAKRVVTFDETAGVATMGDNSSPFTRRDNEVTVTNTPDGPVTIKLASMAPQVGHSTDFTNSRGEKGTARILAIG